MVIQHNIPQIGRGSGKSLQTELVEEEFIGEAHACATSVTAQDALFEDLGTKSYVENLDTLASSGLSFEHWDN